jgi:hypothetical protein
MPGAAKAAAAGLMLALGDCTCNHNQAAAV